MKKLLIALPFVLAACSEVENTVERIVPNISLASDQGAGFGPYSLGEYEARAARGEPGTVQYQEPIGAGQRYSEVVRRKNETRVAASRGGGTQDSVEAAIYSGRSTTKVGRVRVGNEDLLVSRQRIDGTSYAVFEPEDGRWQNIGRSEFELTETLPGLTGCSWAGTSYGFSDTRSRPSKIAMALNCG